MSMGLYFIFKYFVFAVIILFG